MDMRISDGGSRYLAKNNLRCNIIIFIETINEVYAQVSLSIRKSFSAASKQRFSKLRYRHSLALCTGAFSAPSGSLYLTGFVDCVLFCLQSLHRLPVAAFSRELY